MNQSSSAATAAQFSLDAEIRGPFNTALAKVKEALKVEGFGVLSEIDVQATLREKIGVELAPYTILGVCNPHLASQAIAVEPKVGVFLPCNILVRQDGERVLISAQDPALIDDFLAMPALRPMAAEARTRLERALEAVT
ncbi:MAG: DUF302 domain-containing protein [Fimbriimonadaceae bacterium]